MYLFLAILALILVVGVWFINQPKFGKNPSGERLERIKKSPNYQDGGFKNLSETPQLTSDKPMVVQLYKFFTDKIDHLRPATPIPTVKTDLKNLSKDENILVWLGHSGYFMQIDGKTFLIDPTLLSGSPVSFFNKMFDGSNAYLPQDIPAVDYLIITHDHWDHLDYETIKQLKPRIGKVVTGLGIGSHFEYWGFAEENIVEMDWNEQTSFGNIKLTALPARHFSGRGLQRKHFGHRLCSKHLLKPSTSVAIAVMTLFIKKSENNFQTSIWQSSKTDSTTTIGHTFTSCQNKFHKP